MITGHDNCGFRIMMRKTTKDQRRWNVFGLGRGQGHFFNFGAPYSVLVRYGTAQSSLDATPLSRVVSPLKTKLLKTVTINRVSLKGLIVLPISPAVYNKQPYYKEMVTAIIAIKSLTREKQTNH